MNERPYVTLSAAMSIDGYLDSAAPRQLAMSNAADLDRVDAVRATQDAIMVGASTVRRDNPRLRVKSADRRAERLLLGLPESPTRVTVTSTGDLPSDARFFRVDDTVPVVYSPTSGVRRLRARLGESAEVVGLGDRVGMGDVLDHLASERGIRRLVVEGGGRLLTQFLEHDLVDELQLVVAPFFVGEAHAPRLVGPARFPWTAERRATLASTEQLGDVVLLRYALSERAELGADLLERVPEFAR